MRRADNVGTPTNDGRLGDPHMKGTMMASTQKGGAKGFLALLVTFAVAFLGLFSTMQASAAPPNDQSTGKLHFHKFDNTNVGLSGGTVTGEQVDSSTFGTPLGGVEFTITPVNVAAGVNFWDFTDLDTDGATVKSGQITVGTLNTAGKTTVTTDDQGNASTGALPLGLYYVTEIGHGTHSISQTTPPFFVSVPLPQKPGAASDFLYDIH